MCSSLEPFDFHSLAFMKMLISRRLLSVTSKQLEKHTVERSIVGSSKNEMPLNQQWIERFSEHLRNAYRDKILYTTNSIPSS